MWDFDADFDADLDLGTRRKPVQWVAVAPPVTERVKQQVHKRAKVRPKKGATSSSADPDVPLSAKAQAAQAAQAIKQRQKAQSLKEEKTPAIASGVHNRTSEAVLLEPEDDEGNVEYKLRLKQPNPVRFQQLVTQMQYRLSEGNGECYYYLGVEDDGYPRGLTVQELDISYNTLKAMAVAVNATIQPLKEMPACRGRVYVIFRISRICLDSLSYTDLRIAVAGSVDSGKSTLVAVLTNGRQGRPLLDNGQGSARMSVFKHKHEIESGRTSSLSHHMLAYDSDHRVLNYADVAPMMPSEIAAAARKVVRFIDLGGHQKYLKTALYGLTSLIPDYVLVCICPLTGLTQVTREHMAVALALELPLAFLITKVDVAPAEAVEVILEQIQQILIAASSGHCITGLEPQTMEGPLYTLINTESEAIDAASHATQPAPPKLKCVPVFTNAATTGVGLSVLHAFLSHLRPRNLPRGSSGLPNSDQDSPNSGGDFPEVLDEGATEGKEASDTQPAHFQVDQTFEVRGVGSVVSGTLVTGEVKLNQQLLLGTQSNGDFTPVVVTSIQRAQVPVKAAMAGQHATLAIHCLDEPSTGVVGVETNGTVMARTSEDGQMHVPSAMLDPISELPVPAEFLGLDASDAQRPANGQAPESSAASPAIKVGEARPTMVTAAAHSSSGSKPEEGFARGQPVGVTDRRHDIWQCSSQGSPFLAAAGNSSGLLSQTRTSSSVSGDSDQSDSPRLPFLGRPSQRLSAEDALGAVEDLSLKDAGPSQRLRQYQKPVEITAPQPIAALAQQCEQHKPLVGSNLANSMDFADAATSDEERQLRSATQARELQKPSNPRKGTVLLDAAFKPKAVWQFEAVMVLLSGFWPARGLLSGDWPPLGDSDGDDTPAEAGIAKNSPVGSFDQGRTMRSRSLRAKQRPAYSPVVHCGSVRQAARVVAMSEVALPVNWQIRDCCQVTGCNLEPAIASAACLLSHDTTQEGMCEESCVAVVTFRFIHQPEWLQKGAHFVVRDCTESCTSGAGVVRQLLPDC